MNVYKNVNICNKSKIKSSQLLVCKVKQSEKLATKFLKVFLHTNLLKKVNCQKFYDFLNCIK